MDDDDEAVAVELSEKELNRRNKSNRSRIITGQIPQIVSNEDDDEVEILEETNSMQNQAEAFKANYPINEVPYVNLPQSKFGKVVMGQEKKQKANNVKKLKIEGEKYTIYPIRNANGTVQFAHPRIGDHRVMCASVEDAADWLKTFESQKLTLKPMEELMPKKKEQIIINSDGKKGLNIFLSKKFFTSNFNFQLAFS